MNKIKLRLGAPSEKQALFLADTHRNVGFGGARGGGKSHAVRMKAQLLCAAHGGIRVCIVRRTYPELLGNHISVLRREIPPEAARYVDREKAFHWINGSLLAFRCCDSERALDRWQGAQYDVIFFDEAGLIPWPWLERMAACCRGANDFPKRCYYTFNPGGISHEALRRLFIRRQFRPEEDPGDYAFIRSLVTDNPALMVKDPDYRKRLERLPAPLRRAWLEGDFDAFEGQVFQEFRDDPSHYIDRLWTHVIEPFEIPGSWRRFRSFDFGYAKPFSVGWWAMDFDGRLYRILELYGCTGTANEGVRWTPDRIFQTIAETEREHRWLRGQQILGVADPSIWDASRGESVNDCAIRHGVFWTPGDNARIPGWMQLHRRLAFDGEGLPGLYVFRNCSAFIRTVPALVFDRHRPEDVDTAAEDHVADETRYLCMARPIRPEREPAPVPLPEDPLQLLPRR